MAVPLFLYSSAPRVHCPVACVLLELSAPLAIELAVAVCCTVAGGADVLLMLSVGAAGPEGPDNNNHTSI